MVLCLRHTSTANTTDPSYTPAAETDVVTAYAYNVKHILYMCNVNATMHMLNTLCCVYFCLETDGGRLGFCDKIFSSVELPRVYSSLYNNAQLHHACV